MSNPNIMAWFSLLKIVCRMSSLEGKVDRIQEFKRIQSSSKVGSLVVFRMIGLTDENP